jgi:methionine-rich copper-binding protein CopC
VKAIAKCALFAAGLALAVQALPAKAHAFLDHADPRVGSTVVASPAQVTLRFTEKLEPAFSTVKVLDAAGKQVDAHDGKVEAATMRVTIRDALAPGKYRVVWRALSIDTHVTDGEFTFEVGR